MVTCRQMEENKQIYLLSAGHLFNGKHHLWKLKFWLEKMDSIFRAAAVEKAILTNQKFKQCYFFHSFPSNHNFCWTECCQEIFTNLSNNSWCFPRKDPFQISNLKITLMNYILEYPELRFSGPTARNPKIAASHQKFYFQIVNMLITSTFSNPSLQHDITWWSLMSFQWFSRLFNGLWEI